MNHNATLTSGTATYGGGAFGNGVLLSGGVLEITGSVDSTIGTLALWIHPTSASGTTVFFSGSNGYAGLVNGAPVLNLTERLTSSIAVTQGTQNHIAYVFDGTNVTIWVNGQQAAQAPSSGFTPVGMLWGSATPVIGGLGTGDGFAFPDIIGELSLWSSAKYSAAFTPPTAPTLNTASGLTALYHLVADGTDSAGNTAGSTGYTLTATTTSPVVGVPDTITATLTPIGTITPSAITINLSDSGSSNTISPITIAAGSVSGSTAFSALAGGTHTLTGSHTGGGFTGGDGSIALAASGSSNLTTSPTSFAPSLLQHSIFLTSVNGAYSSSWNPSFTGPAGFQLISSNYLTGECIVVPGSAAGTININDGTYATTVPVTGSAPNYVTPNATGIQYYGPWSVNSGYAACTYDGNTVEISWTGDYIDVGTIAESLPPSLLVEVDGIWQSRVTEADLVNSPVFRVSPQYTSQTSLTVLAHTMTLWIEGIPDSIPGFKIGGYELPAGGAILPTLAAPSWMLAIGDSITATSAELSPPMGQPSPSEDTMAAHTGWAAICAGKLGLKLGVIAQPGQTMPAMLTQFEGAYGSTPANQPRIVVFYLGTNSAPGGVTTAQATAFYAQVRSTMPSSLIVGIAPNANSPSTYPALAAAVAAIGDPKMKALDYTTGVYGSADTYDGTHPNLGGHAKLGTRAAYDIQTQLNALPATTTASSPSSYTFAA